jgi:hypothetical protein
MPISSKIQTSARSGVAAFWTMRAQSARAGGASRVPARFRILDCEMRSH